MSVVEAPAPADRDVVEPPTTVEPEGAAETGAVAISVERGWRVLIASDLHLRALSDDDSEEISSELARRIESWVGPGVVVLAGDTFEFLDEPKNSPQRAMTAHPRLADSLRRFSEAPERQLVVLAGERDARLLTDPRDQRELAAYGAVVAQRGDLSIDTGTGSKFVRVEHCASGSSADGDPEVEACNQEVESSRRFYALMQRLWWIPMVAPAVAMVGGLLVAVNVSNNSSIRDMSPLRWLYFVCSMISVQIVVAALLVTFVTLSSRPSDAVANLSSDPNRVGRAIATALAVGGGEGPLVDGYVGTGSHAPELVDLADCWYANSGCATHHVSRRESHFGLPPVFAPTNEVSWLELEAGATLHVTLIASRRDETPPTLTERLAARSRVDVPPVPTEVAQLRPGSVWPTPRDPFRRINRTRRRGALGMMSVGLVDLMSALTPPVRDRLRVIRQIIPVGTPAFAAGIVAATGIGLIMLATGLRRGRRLAWQLGMLLLVVSTVGHVVKGFDLEEAVIAGLFAVWLGVHHRSFHAPSGDGHLRQAAIFAASSLGAVGLAATGWIWIGGHRRLDESLEIAFGRMIGLPVASLPRHMRLLESGLPAVAIAAALVVGWYVLRVRRAPIDDPATSARTWEIVREYGRGTLDYFALRDDKRHFIAEDTVVAYTVAHGTAVVSPDPVGPPDQRGRAWLAFRAFAAEHGWHVAALGAGAGWLPVYRSTGMWAMYIGDESVVDVQRFNLEGGRNKSLRKAVNRVAKAGYTVEFHDPATIDPVLAGELRELATQSRQGSVERGFSMTLSRLFDPRDVGLLLALARDAAGRPAAFCQFVPAAGIDGFSLDLMRRGDAGRKGKSAGVASATSNVEPGAEASGHPNGLTEFVVVRTIEHLRELGRHGLGLHFATMRALLAGQTGSRIWHRALAELMHRMSDDMQIESLWKFNAKFDPTWLPRYVVLDRPESTLFAGLAIARVESLWELPVIGRFMRPSDDVLTH